jgi:hypothetical protein
MRNAIRGYILSGQPERREAGTTRLERWRGLIDIERMALRWSRENDAGNRQRLAAAYSRVAHADIAERATQLSLVD